jgi:hypothetical protein
LRRINAAKKNRKVTWHFLRELEDAFAAALMEVASKAAR